MKPKPGRPPRAAKDVEMMRDRIADQALLIFQADGFDALSIRRLAREVGCSPMTIYAHFDGKPEILRHLWGAVLGQVFAKISAQLQEVAAPEERLRLAAQCFVAHWLQHPDQFRMVFMSSGVARADVANFMSDRSTIGHFETFMELVAQTSVPAGDVKIRTEALIMGLIGVALSCNTIRDYPWSDPAEITDILVAGVLRA